MKTEELEAELWERGDYISYLEFKLLQRRFGYPEPPPYELKPKQHYIQQVRELKRLGREIGETK